MGTQTEREGMVQWKSNAPKVEIIEINPAFISMVGLGRFVTLVSMGVG